MTTQAQAVETKAAATVAKKAPKAKAATPTVKVADKVVEKAAPKAAKPAAKRSTASKAKPKAATGILFMLSAGSARPVSGANLHAHTQAVLELSGMVKGKGAPKALLARVMGETAVRYNMKEGKFALNEKGEVVLTAAGKAGFETRSPDRNVVELFKSILTTGKPDGAIVKNADLIQKLA